MPQIVRYLSHQNMSMDESDQQKAKKLKLDEMVTIKEGSAEILIPNKSVFYNPVQEFNRDLSVAVLNMFAMDRCNEELQKHNTKNGTSNVMVINDANGFQSGITVLEALSATGLRSIRYAKEVKNVKKIIANDFSAKAIASIKDNIKHNAVENLVESSHEDASMVMYKNKNTFDAIDIDPYGCAAMFLDSAVQSVSDGGILMVTATDMATLAGNFPESCYAKYNAISLKSKACHEIALRILLQNIASHAGRYGRYIVPALSVSVDFYIRVFVRVYSSQLKCKENLSKLGMVYQCSGCETFTIQPLSLKISDKKYKLPVAPTVDQTCKYCKYKHHIGGPIWISSLHNREFVGRLLSNISTMNLNTAKRIEGVLNMVYEELDVPLYYTLDRLMSIIKCVTPSMLTFRSALLNAGYKVSFSHANKVSVKTDAPNDVIWDIVRAWEKNNPVKREKFQQNSPSLAILDAPCTREISFDIHSSANPESRRKHLSRFQVNPTEYWGPGTRNKAMLNVVKTDLKKIRNQNKKSKRSSDEMDTKENDTVKQS